MKIFNIPLYVELPADVDRRFKEVTPQRFLPFMRIGLAIGFMSYPFWLYWDYRMGTQDSFMQALYIRLGMMGVFQIAFALSFLRQTGRVIYLQASAVLLATVWTTYATLRLVPGGLLLCNGIGLIPMIFVIGMSSFWMATATLCLSMAVMEAYLLAAHSSGAALLSFNFTHLTLVGLSVGLVYVSIQLRRHSFLLETNLERATQAAEAANKAKSDFLATMSHEVRTPLTGILGIIGLLTDTPLAEKQRDYVETVRYSGETLLTILNDILDFSKMEAGKFDLEPVDFDVGRLAGGVVDLMRSRALEKNLALSTAIGEGVPPFLHCDATRLRQVLLNLVGNAIKFTAAGGVTLRVVRVAGDGNRVRLRFEVQDTGIGLSEEARGKLFQDYAQADSSVSRRYGGTGLGLAICRKIVELMQGTIGVSSRPGEGSTFWFEVPADIAAGAAPEVAAVSAAAVRPLSVLVAEDNKVNQKVITGLLEKAGHRVTLAGDGQEALRLLGDAGAGYDLVLMDMQMPVLDGIAATMRLRQSQGAVKKIPVIALTANAAGGDELRCREAGMNDYVSKPVNPEALYRAIAGQVQAASPAAAAPTPPQAPALENLVNLEKVMGRDYVTKFVGDGLAEVDRLVAELNRAADNDNADDMRRAAHELKGISAMFGLSPVRTLAEGIEMCCFENRGAEAKALAGRLGEGHRTSLAAFRQQSAAAGWASRG
jgi:signal transduction histidine kinase/FixJ family two-component response regulator/HPt (histidine-containing phosphotransfer) domain-containing protein